MDSRERLAGRRHEPVVFDVRPRTGARHASAALTGGGTDGNGQITALAGIVLIVLLFVIGITILRIRQLISIHLFVGLLLIGPVALKMASTGYRFVRYYTGDPEYRHKGPPQIILRSIAPAVVLTTILVLASGIILMFRHPTDTGPWLSIHKVSFIIWIIFTALHVLGHLPGLGRALRAVPASTRELDAPTGNAGRWIALIGALIGGLVLAVVLIPDFHTWTASGAFPHHDG
jgi:hypothetical protein